MDRGILFGTDEAGVGMSLFLVTDKNYSLNGLVWDDHVVSTLWFSEAQGPSSRFVSKGFQFSVCEHGSSPQDLGMIECSVEDRVESDPEGVLRVKVDGGVIFTIAVA